MVKGILVNRKSDESLKLQLKMEHADLVAEMQTVENLPTHERLQLARLRRTQQLKVARQKEKEWMKLQRAKGNAQYLNHHLNTSTTHHFRNSTASGSQRGHISFENSVVLLEAASRNDMQEVAELLQHNITPDAANEDGLTALHQCCIDNNVEMLRLLLQYGANVDAQDSDKWTPLHAAATCGHLELVRILIEHGANLLAVNTDGNMPYDLCDDENTLDFIEAEMSKRGVTQELIDETRSATESQMLKDLMDIAQNGGDLEEPDHQGATPLHIASANGYVRVVESLLEMHVNVDAMDKDMWSPVHAAACWGHLEVLEMLAQCGADLNVKNKDDETPSDICEDPEIRERIEQLKTEQESKRLAEAQRRRVRRSQSNNTRAQSVRRTSLRDKTLTTKKDAVEEARLRLQAQEIFIAAAPDGGSDSSNAGSATHSSSANATNSAAWLSKGTNNQNTSNNNKTHNSHSNNNNISSNNNNNNNINSNGSAEQQKSYQASLAYNGVAGGGGGTSATATALSHSMSVDAVDTTNTNNSVTSYVARRPPDGRDNDEMQPNGAGGMLYKPHSEHHRSASSSAVLDVDSLATEMLQIQSSKESTNGKINVQVTVLVDTTNAPHHHQQQQIQQQQQQRLHQPNTATTNTLYTITPTAQSIDCGATTLANLKKQRSLSRSNVLSNNCEHVNGSVPGAATTNNNITMLGAAGPDGMPLGGGGGCGGGGELTGGFYQSKGSQSCNSLVSQQPIGNTAGNMNPGLMMLDYGNAVIPTTDGLRDGNAAAAGAAGTTAASSVNKFSGMPGDVVSDSTSSRKCCMIM